MKVQDTLWLKLNIAFYAMAELLNLGAFLVCRLAGDMDLYIWLLSIIICTCYFVTAAVVIRQTGVVSMASIFWICLFAFGISRLFLYLMGVFDFMHQIYGIFGIFDWEEKTAVTVLNYYLLFMASFSVMLFLSLRSRMKKAPLQKPRRENPIKYLRQPLYVVFYAMAPIVLVFFTIQAILVNRLGYVSLYNGTLNAQIPFLSVFSIARLAFTVSFYAILSFEDDQKNFLQSMAVFLVVNAIPLAQGSRAEFIIYLLACLFVYCTRFHKNFSVMWLIVGLVAGIPVLDAISYIRSGLALPGDFLAGAYRKFFSELSTSFNVVAYYVQNQEDLSINTYPYIMEPIVKVFQYYANVDIYSSGQTQAMAEIRFQLGHQITYHISPGYYLMGHNFASNFIAEMAEFGPLGVIGFSFVFLFLVFQIEEQITQKSPYFGFMCIEFCLWIFMAPRASAFYDTYNLMKYGIIFLLLYGVSAFLQEMNTLPELRKGRKLFSSIRLAQKGENENER